MEDKIDEAMIDFENRMKRSVNLCDDKIKTVLMAKVQGLKRHPDNRFVEDHAIVSRYVCLDKTSLSTADDASADMKRIFKPLLEGITDLMKSQIRLATDAGLHIQVWVFPF